MAQDTAMAVVDVAAETTDASEQKAVVARAEPAAIIQHTEPTTLLAMLERVIVNPDIPMERVNQAFDFYKRVDEDQARKAFSAAMADAKAEFTPIVKRHLVEFGKGESKTAYKHEDLADIAEVIDPILGRHGLSYRYRGTSNLNEPISVTCIVSHRLGYAEETTLRAGADSSGGKNSIQAIGSTVKYLQRYTLILSLGIATRRDDDGKAAGEQKPSDTITEEQEGKLREMLDSTGSDIPVFCKYFGIRKYSDLKAADFDRAIAALKKKAEQQ